MAKRFVVGVDGSENSKVALKWAYDEAIAHKADLDVVLVWSYPYVGDPVVGAYSGEMIVELEQAEQKLLDEMVAWVTKGSTGVRVTPKLILGATAPVLLEEAEGADLLVVGSRGRGGFASLLLGSTSTQVVHHAPCTVVVIPMPKSAD